MFGISAYRTFIHFAISILPSRKGPSQAGDITKNSSLSILFSMRINFIVLGSVLVGCKKDETATGAPGNPQPAVSPPGNGQIEAISPPRSGNDESSPTKIASQQMNIQPDVPSRNEGLSGKKIPSSALNPLGSTAGEGQNEAKDQGIVNPRIANGPLSEEQKKISTDQTDENTLTGYIVSKAKLYEDILAMKTKISTSLEEVPEDEVKPDEATNQEIDDALQAVKGLDEMLASNTRI
jgi:hypothetical protein